MKICLYSDLHLESNRNLQPKDVIDPNADLIIDCGDTGELATTIDWYKKPFFRDRRVLFVSGNHTYYNNDIKYVDKILRGYKSNIFYLSNTSTVIDNITFFGATFWTDFYLYGKRSQNDCKALSNFYVNDNKHILSNGHLINCNSTQRLHNTSVRLLQTLCDSTKNPIIVLSHHAPSWMSSLPVWQNNLLTSAFCSNLEWMCLKYTNIKYWLHGHVHNFCDYTISQTRVLCNPHGYKKENPKFNILTFDV